MCITEGNRRIGRWSALLAAYAFVLNALLATTLLAATLAGRSLSGFELCTAGTDTPSRTDDKSTKRAAIHCQICLQHAAPVALPPPLAQSLTVPVAQVVTFPFPRAESTAPGRRLFDHPPRGPPHLS